VVPVRLPRGPFFAFAVCAVVVACSSDVATDFPPGLAPIEDVGTVAPTGTPTDPHPETLDLDKGLDDDSNWVHAVGYVHASVKDVYAALATPDVIADRHNVTSYTTTMNVEDYEVSFRLHYKIDNVVTVEFDVTFREGRVTGTPDAPTAVSVVYSKTYGSNLVKMMRGSIEVTTVDDHTSEIRFAQRMVATQTNEDNIAKWTQGIFASVVAKVHGQPLP
jgi:hypothetical protein